MLSISFNDQWSCNGEPVTLPHDAMIREKRSPDTSNGGHGYFPGGIYTYKKVFSVPAEWAGKTVLAEFEGVYRHAAVSLNGQQLCYHAYGYTGFYVELSNLKPGQENTLTVVADNSQLPNSRWYSGSGIYRPVWLHICEPNGLRPECVKVTTQSYHPAVIRVESPVSIQFEACGVSGAGTDFTLELPGAKLWSAEEPNLCTAHITAGPQDTMDLSFGICKIEWSLKGLFLNGQRTLLRGGCIHHDSGILGAATYAESEERRVRILKENGFNAIRSAHNPASKALLDACDRLGMYVMDETFDMWYSPKTAFDYAQDFDACWEEDVTSMVQRDRTHPSVILYSIGNEVAEPHESKGLKAGQKMIDLIHRLDSTRPVTCGTNLMIIGKAAKGNSIYKDPEDNEKRIQRANDTSKAAPENASLAFNIMVSFIGTGMNKAGNSKKVDQVTTPFLDSLDIAGYNYASGRYSMEGKAHPNRVIFGSETFPQDICKNWQMMQRYPYLVGDFMWTAWDYLGEAGIGAWSYNGGMPFNRPYPWVLGGAGVIDILGNPDGSCLYAQVVWGLLERPVVAVKPVNHPGVRPSTSVWRGTNAIPSWSWSSCTGNKAEIEVYAQGASTELFLNGRSIGKKKLKDYRAIFHAKYVPGVLRAVAYDALGHEISCSEICSAQGNLHMVLRPEKSELSPGKICFVPLTIEGSNGIVDANADRTVQVSVENGELLAFGSANPCTEEQYHTGTFTTYYGRAMAIVRAKEPGVLRITAADGTDTAVAEISVQRI